MSCLSNLLESLHSSLNPPPFFLQSPLPLTSFLAALIWPVSGCRCCSACVWGGRGGLTDENTWDFWICLSNSRNWITHRLLSKVLKFAAFQSRSGISVHLSVVFVQAWCSQKLFLQCSLKGDGQYPSSVVPDFRSQDWTVMYWIFICMS